MNATRESFETLPTRPTDYMGWHPMNAGEDIPNPDRWRYMGTLDHRDSDIIAQSNAAYICDALKQADPDEEHHAVVSVSHWAVGHADDLYIDIDHDVADVYAAILDRLSNYPILDEDDVSQRETDDIHHLLEVHYGLSDDEMATFWENCPYPSDVLYGNAERIIGDAIGREV